MLWNDHSKLIGTHAFLGASNYHWLNWSNDILEKRYSSKFSTEVGTAIHELASDCIKNRIKLNENDIHLIEVTLCKLGIPSIGFDAKEILFNLAPFVNDAIGYHMDSEILLYFSYNCYGTADAICFNEKTKTLRIHDLKTGITPTHMEQLLIYAALFCLEYKKKPKEINIELRIYQEGEIASYKPQAEEIEKIIDIIKNKNDYIVNYLEKRR